MLNKDEQSTDYGDVHSTIHITTSGHHVGDSRGGWDALITFMLLAFVLAIVGGLVLSVVGLLGMVFDVFMMLFHG
jgi:hypothetical protein